MPNQTLANYKEPNINGLDAAMIFANTALENIYQAEIEKGGRGVTQKFSSDTTGAQIRVVRPLPLPIDARELGASINGGNFSAYSYQPESDSYGLNIITVIDDMVDIPDVSMDMIPVEIAKMYIQNISDKVVLNINAIKIAARAYTCFSAHQVDSSKAFVTEYDSSTDNVVEKAIETNAKLNKGDKEHGVSAFPVKDRIALVSNDSYSALLSAKGVFTLGGANYAYDILRKGGVDSEAATPELLDDGYIGTIAGVPYHFVSDLILEVVCKYLGFPSGTFDGVVEHVASAHGNLFALATGNSIKTIDSPLGQGVRLQPKYRMGAACIMPKSVSWLVKKGWVNPYTLKAIFASGIEWSYKAPGSRQVLKASITGAGSKAFTFGLKKVVKAADGSTSEVAVTSGFYGAWVDCGTSPISTVSEFLTKYNANGAVKDTLATTDFGSSQTLSSITAGHYVALLVIDSQGTVADVVCDEDAA